MENYVADFMHTPRTMLRDLGARLRSRRIAAKLTQDALAKRAGVSRDTVTRIERGSSIGLEQLLNLAFALDASAEFRGLFPHIDIRTLDEILAAQREPQRVRRRQVTAPPQKRRP